MRDPEAPWASRLTAATWVVERAYGKTKETLSLDGIDGVNIMIVTGVPDPDNHQQPVATETFTIEYEPGEDRS
jgi:hypothetical protein